MNIEEAMVAIIEEAERQGFRVTQLHSGAWRIARNEKTFIFPTPSNALALLEILRELIAAGLDWSRWE